MKRTSFPKTVGVVGLGLMGGSLAATVRRLFPGTRVIGMSRNAKAVRTALRKKWIHEGSRELKAASKADLIILCTPVNTLQKLMTQMDKVAQPGTLVTDVGSVKGSVVKWAEKKKFKNIEFVGAHPMAGSHIRGIGAASKNLYEGCLTFVCPSRAHSRSGYQKVTRFWRKMSQRVVAVSAKRHDEITSDISHLPRAVANCLVLATSDKSLKFASGGFADTTRVAQGDSSIWVPIFQHNRKAILTSLNHFELQVKKLKKALRQSDFTSIKTLFERAGRKRKRV